MLKIAIAQMNAVVGDFKGNSMKMLTMIDDAVKQKADVIVFPELSLCGYPPEDLLLKQHFIEANIKALVSLSRKVRDIVALVGFVDSDAKGHCYNAAAVIIDGKVTDVYAKQELPNYGVFDEKRYFSPGQKRGLVTIKGIKVGITICEDIWVDGSVYQQEVLAKAKAIINISASPFEVGKLEKRMQLLKRRSKETQVPIVYVNAVGGQDELVFDGGSMVYGPSGEIEALCPQFKEGLFCHTLGQKQPKESLVLPDRIAQMYEALVLGTRDYVRKNGFEKVAIGLSGGIDSALVAAIAVDALGPKQVVGISMPSMYNSKATQSDAANLAKNLGIEFKIIPIQDTVKVYTKTLAKHFEGAAPNIAEENIQARIRGNILMAFSNKFGWLILTTGNKSEMAVGYCTLYGDMSGGFAVIKDVFKTDVYALARWRNSLDAKSPIPKSIILRAPSAELRPNQTDEASLGSYEDLDLLLKAYIEDHADISDLSVGHLKKDYVLKMVHMMDRNEYKRRQSPPGVKVSPRAFGRDWRLPLTNKYRMGA